MTTECRAEGRIDCSDRVEHEDYGVGTVQDLQLIGSERCAYVTWEGGPYDGETFPVVTRYLTKLASNPLLKNSCG